MGTTIRREPVNFAIPAAPDYKFLNITNFRGLDVSSNPFELANNTASDCLNVYVDETNTLTTRPRLEKKADALIEGTHIGTYNLHNGYLLHYLQDGVGVLATWIDDVLTQITGKDLTPDEADVSLKQYYTLPTVKCQYFEQDDKIYLLDGERYSVIADNVLSEVEGYVPTTAVVDASGNRKDVDVLNLLTDKYAETLSWNNEYLPDLYDDESVVDIKTFWTDKTAALSATGITTDTEIGAVYDDGSFCAIINKDVVYYESKDDFNSLSDTTVFEADPYMTYSYTFAKDSKTFAVIRTNPSTYESQNAKGFRVENGVWTEFNISLSLSSSETLLAWSLSRDGSHILCAKKSSGDVVSVRWLMPVATQYQPDEWSFDLGTYKEFTPSGDTPSVSDLVTITSAYAFNGEAGVCGLLRLTNGMTLSATNSDNKLTRVGASLDSLSVLDYSVDGKTIVYTWSGLWGKYVIDFEWDNPTLNDWVDSPTETTPVSGLEEIQPKAELQVSSTPFVGWCAGGVVQNTALRDIHYLGDISAPDFTGKALGRLGLNIPKTDLSRVYANFSRIILCFGENIHLYVRPAGEIAAVSIIKRLNDKDERYFEWLNKQQRLLKSKLFTRFDNNYWLAEGNRYYRSQNNDPTYFPITEYNDLGDSNEPITGFNLANDTTLLAYKSDRLYLIQPFTSSLDTTEYTITESKNTVGNTAIGAPIVTTLTEIPLQINNDGIYGLSQLQNVSAVERIADLMSEPINEKWLKEDDVVISNAKTINRLYWTYVILPCNDKTKVYLLDNRSNSWYYWELPVAINDAFVKDNVTEFVDKTGAIYYLTPEDIINKAFLPLLVTEYYDYGRKLIPWYWQSQILHLGTMNYSKRLVNTTFILTDTDTQDGYGLQYSFKVFRKLASSTPEKEISDELNLVRSTTKKTNISKFGFVQLKLSNITEESQGTDPEKAYRNNKLRLVGLGLKYVLLEGLIR